MYKKTGRQRDKVTSTTVTQGQNPTSNELFMKLTLFITTTRLNHVGADDHLPVRLLPLVSEAGLEGVGQSERVVRAPVDLLPIDCSDSHRVEHNLAVGILQEGFLLHPTACQQVDFLFDGHIEFRH